MMCTATPVFDFIIRTATPTVLYILIGGIRTGVCASVNRIERWHMGYNQTIGGVGFRLVVEVVNQIRGNSDASVGYEQY